jgi:apolipoprotein N-acyltransferase
MHRALPLTTRQRVLLSLVSFLIVGCGQPAWSWISGLIAAAFGYALFWRVLLSIETTSHRFWLATLWTYAIQLVHTSWMISHPFLYIYGVWLLFCFLCSLQFGLVSLLIVPKRVERLGGLVLIASCWTLMEWLRLFFMSGYTWNPTGLALTGHIYPLQMASFWGIYGLSFFAILVNLLFLRAWVCWRRLAPIALWAMAAAVPYLYGYVHYTYHEQLIAKQAGGAKTLSVVLVQPAFLPEEGAFMINPHDAIEHVMGEWTQILKILSKQKNEVVNLIVLPEYVVPFGTYSPIFSFERMRDLFEEHFGKESLAALPPLEAPWAATKSTPRGDVWLVNNAFMVQALSNLFQSEVVVGLEDVEQIADKQFEFFSAALCFHPNNGEEQRYEKRVLVPMAEYIPFTFCKELAATYGIGGSFSPGKAAKVFEVSNVPFGCCICYEETFGDLMRESRLLGAELLVNITSDVWFPNSRLPKQHFDHARLRTVESGIPLVRACNTGITCALDSLGRVVASLGEGRHDFEWISDSIRIDVPLYTYSTLYSRWGDRPIIGFCLISLLSWVGMFAFRSRKR